MRRATHPVTIRQKYGALVDCIADLLGVHAEVVLHDVTHPDKSVVMIRNGQVTGRSVGAPLTDLGFYMLRECDRKIETLGVYRSTTDTGKTLKCNAVNLRDNRGRVEAILCINLDVASAQDERIPGGPSASLAEHYQTSIDQVIRTMITDLSGNSRAGLLPEQRFRIVGALDERGIFLARGSVKQVATALKIAAPTVYKYIARARRERSRPRSGSSRPRSKMMAVRSRSFKASA
jgi:predicted transcriptional regulator YheO